MAYEMYDYLNGTTPDYNYTLDTTLQSSAIGMYRVIVETGFRNQIIFLGDDASDVVIEFDSNPIFYVEMGWEGLDASDAGTVFDLYFDPTKANRRAKSFKWNHPEDGHTYVVRFDMNLERSIDPITGIHRLPNIKFKVLGYPT